MASDVAHANRIAWDSAEVADIFVRREGFVSGPEALVMQRVAREVCDQPILDIGVGGGRTTAFLRSVTAEYVGVDYLERLVLAARSRYPDARIEHMDARDLSAFADKTFALVVFSLNGIDGVAHEDRRTILSEVRRVLRPHGLFAYSTHNLDYRLSGRRPRHSEWSRIFEHPARAVRYALRLPELRRERRRLSAMTARGEGWATMVNEAYGCAVAWHHVTLVEALRELARAGFTAEVEAYGPSGITAVVEANGTSLHSRAIGSLNTREWPSIHLVVRKP